MSFDGQIVDKKNSVLFPVNKGMWIFIFFDFILFLGLILFHYLNGLDFPKEYDFAKSELLFSFAVLNTFILITSGLTIGLSKVAAHDKNKFLSTVFISITVIFGLLFVAGRATDCVYLAGKGYQYGLESFEVLNDGISIFFTSYFFTYFVFMLHLLIGLVMLLILLVRLVRTDEISTMYAKLNSTAIYWSYLVMVWIFIFSMLFLI
ncbi:MAG: cytochrome c oxidase subunit 3 [Bacteroidota bacterium]